MVESFRVKKKKESYNFGRPYFFKNKLKEEAAGDRERVTDTNHKPAADLASVAEGNAFRSICILT